MDSSITVVEVPSNCRPKFRFFLREKMSFKDFFPSSFLNGIVTIIKPCAPMDLVGMGLLLLQGQRQS